MSVAYQFLTMLAYSTPIFVVWLVGIGLALARRKQHPEAATLLVVCFTISLLVTFFQSLAGLLMVRWSQPQTAWSVLAVVSSLIRLLTWILALTAALGWRQSGDETKSPLQFSIRGLMLFTVAVALMCCLARASVWLLGDSPYLVYALDDLPIILCWVVGGWLAVTRWKEHPQVSMILLTGLALNLANACLSYLWIISLAAPGFSQSGGFQLFALIQIINIALSSAGWAMIIAAALGWRTAQQPLERAAI